jgi:acyl-ACP thioesterase
MSARACAAESPEEVRHPNSTLFPCHHCVVDSQFVACPPGGREVVRTRRVRLGDVTAEGRIRLDAVARYLQDVAADDVDDAGIEGAWVMRRMALRLDRLPAFRDDLELRTFCSGTGSRWAERRTTIRSGGSVAIEAVALWVYLDERGRPAPLENWFFELYGTAAAGRRVSGRLRHRPPPDGVACRPWALRATDFDVLAHVNNAASWAAVEDELARIEPARTPVAAEIEYRAPIDFGDVVELCSVATGDRLTCWLTCAGDVRTSAVVSLA